MTSKEGTHHVVAIVYPDREDTANRDLDARARSRNNWHRTLWHRSQGKAYLETEHSFTLFRGDVSTGRTRKMLGREAKGLNEDYEAKFIKDKTARLYRWKWDKPRD